MAKFALEVASHTEVSQLVWLLDGMPYGNCLLNGCGSVHDMPLSCGDTALLGEIQTANFEFFECL